MANIRAFKFPVYQPAMRIISNITNGFPAVVTTTFNHQYLTGTTIRLVIPLGYGMMQANQLFGEIVVTGATTFTIPIDTTTFDPFMTPATFPENTQFPQSIPFAENNNMLTAATYNVLPYSAT